MVLGGGGVVIDFAKMRRSEGTFFENQVDI